MSIRDKFSRFVVVILVLGPVLLHCTEEAPVVGLDDVRELILDGEYEQAEVSCRALLAQVEESRGADSYGTATVLDALVESLWRGGKIEPETVELAERAIRTKEHALGPDHVELAESINNLAVIDFFLGRYDEAQELWNRALAIRENALGPEHPDTARILNSLGNLHQTTANYDEALGLYERALRIREQVFGRESREVAQTQHNLAYLMLSTGDYARALDLAESAVAIRESILGPDHPKVSRSLNLFGNVLWETGSYERALEVDERAEKIAIEAVGPEHPMVAAALNNRAEQLRRIGQYEEARALYERAQKIWAASYGPESPEMANSLRSMGELLEQIGEYGPALEAHQRAVAIRETALGPDHPFLALSLTDLGTLCSKTADHESALSALGRAVEIQERSLGAEHPYVADATGALAAALSRSGDGARALELALKSEAIAREHLRLTGRSLSEQLTLDYATSRVRGLDLALSLAADGIEPNARRAVVDAVIRTRAVVLDQLAARYRAVNRTEDPEIARLAAELANARSHLANLTVSGLESLDPEDYRRILEQARGRKEQAERDLAATSVEFAGELERGRLGLEEVMTGLPDSSALLAYTLYEHTDLESRATAKAYLAFVVRRGQVPHVVRLGSAEEIESSISAWKKEVAEGVLRTDRSQEAVEVAYRKTSSGLRERVWDPVASLLRDADRVFVVPDGAVNLVSFYSLPAHDGGYLIDEGPLIHYLSAERDVVPLSDAGSTGKGLLAIGGPDYDEASPLAAKQRAPQGNRTVCPGFDSLHFNPVPETDLEVRRVAALWSANRGDGNPDGDVLLLSGTNAREASFKKESRGRRVLHLATHGFFLGNESSSSVKDSRGIGGMILANGRPAGGVACRNPLLLSGLALAGANHRSTAGVEEEDGILIAEEIAGLDLSGVEWAVLSACDTGVGRIETGEGVFGLRRAMQIAGVRTLILSLWPIDDEATRQWMEALYEGRLRQGLDTPEAVRTAGLFVMQSRRAANLSTHPFYWAAFVAAGDWR